MDIGNIITFGWPTAEFSVGETYESLQWISEDIIKPTLQEIEAINLKYIVANHLKKYQIAVLDLINSIAIVRGYRSEFCVLSYIYSTNLDRKSDAQTYLVWRDAVWSDVSTVIDAYKNGEILPSPIEQLIAQLPKIQWDSPNINKIVNF